MPAQPRQQRMLSRPAGLPAESRKSLMEEAPCRSLPARTNTYSSDNYIDAKRIRRTCLRRSGRSSPDRIPSITPTHLNAASVSPRAGRRLSSHMRCSTGNLGRRIRDGSSRAHGSTRGGAPREFFPGTAEAAPLTLPDAVVRSTARGKPGTAATCSGDWYRPIASSHSFRWRHRLSMWESPWPARP